MTDAELQAACAHLPLLSAALALHAARNPGQAEATVYDQPAAFEAFIRGGGNVPLYEAVSTALAGQLAGAQSLLDMGCGDGHALFPALISKHTLQRLTLVEPAEALLASAVARAQAEQPGLPVQALNEGLGAFAQALRPADQWDVAQATFALQAIPEPERWASLATLRSHVRRLVIVEFDVPVLTRGTPEHQQSLLARYERALGEYDGATRDLVAAGFLLPMLRGQLDGHTAATNWEHPAAVWQARLQAQGWRVQAPVRLRDYFWSPAFLLVAEA